MGRLQFSNSINNNYNNDNNNYYLSSYTIFIIHSSVNIVYVLLKSSRAIMLHLL